MKSFGARPSVGDDGWFVNYVSETAHASATMVHGSETVRNMFLKLWLFVLTCQEPETPGVGEMSRFSQEKRRQNTWASRKQSMENEMSKFRPVKRKGCQEQEMSREHRMKRKWRHQRRMSRETDVKEKEASRQTGGARVANRKGCQQMDGEGLLRGRCETVRTIFGSAPHLNLRFTSFQSRLGAMGRMAL